MNKRFLILPILLGALVTSCGSGVSGGGDSSSGGNTPSTPTNYKARFTEAKNNTIESVQYEYNFNLEAKIKFKGAVSYSPAQYSGTTYVNTANQGTQFLQKRDITGLLVIDSTNYIYNVGTDLIKISADEDKDFSVINHETVSSVYDFDKFNFGVILKNLSDSNLLGAEYKNGKYILSLHTNFSQDSLLSVLNYIDSNKILKALNAYTKSEWGISFNVNTWATLTDDNAHLKQFHFDASVNIKDTFDIGFTFDQTFTKYSGVNIVLPSFENTTVVDSEVTAQLNYLKDIYNASKNTETSYYDYKVKTTVDHGVSKSNPLGLAVNSTTQGYARRQILDNIVFFNNRLEVDSDYKNADQLGDLVSDYDSYRAKLNDDDKSVYDVLDPKVGFNKYTLLENYDEESIDEYYMLPASSFLSYDNVKVIKSTTGKDNTKTYKFGLSTDAVKYLLKEYNKSFRIDFNRETIFDIYNIKADFVAKKANFTVTLTEDNKLLSIDIDLKGFYTEKDSEDQVKYRLEVSIDYDWSKSYSAVSKKEDIDNK